jgi:hypothetical protein
MTKFMYLSVYLFIHLSVYLFIYLSVFYLQNTLHEIEPRWNILCDNSPEQISH